MFYIILFEIDKITAPKRGGGGPKYVHHKTDSKTETTLPIIPRTNPPQQTNTQVKITTAHIKQHLEASARVGMLAKQRAKSAQRRHADREAAARLMTASKAQKQELSNAVGLNIIKDPSSNAVPQGAQAPPSDRAPTIPQGPSAKEAEAVVERLIQTNSNLLAQKKGAVVIPPSSSSTAAAAKPENDAHSEGDTNGQLLPSHSNFVGVPPPPLPPFPSSSGPAGPPPPQPSDSPLHYSFNGEPLFRIPKDGEPDAPKSALKQKKTWGMATSSRGASNQMGSSSPPA